MRAVAQLEEHERKAIESVLDYLSDDIEEFQQLLADGDQAENHIGQALAVLSLMLGDETLTRQIIGLRRGPWGNGVKR